MPKFTLFGTKRAEKATGAGMNKTERLNALRKQCQLLQVQTREKDGLIAHLEAQYQRDATARTAYKKSTYEKLSRAYDERDALTAELKQRVAEMEEIQTESDIGSSESGSLRSQRSWESSAAKSTWSTSTSVAQIGWDCGTCAMPNFTDPFEPGAQCGCGHVFCENDTHCAIQWNPDAA